MATLNDYIGLEVSGFSCVPKYNFPLRGTITELVPETEHYFVLRLKAVNPRPAPGEPDNWEDGILWSVILEAQTDEDGNLTDPHTNPLMVLTPKGRMVSGMVSPESPA